MVDDEEFSLNKEFQECAVQLADLLDLDEIESVKVLLAAQSEVDVIDRSISISAAILFQQRKQFLLECLRLVLVVAVDSEVDESFRDSCRNVVAHILGGAEGSATSGPDFVFQCLKAMFALEERLYNLSQRAQAANALGQSSSLDRDELHLFEEQSLTNQHESLCGIISLLVKASYSSSANFEDVLDRMSKIDRWSSLTIHYCPIVLSLIAQYGSPDGIGSLSEARGLHEKIVDRKDVSIWTLRYLQAAIQTWWLAEYSGWYSDQYSNSPLSGVDLEKEAIQRSEFFFQALKDGAFQCTLSVCSQITQSGIYDPAKSSLVAFLLRDASLPQPDRLHASNWFQLNVAEQLESFIDSLITNMPDTLRQFKFEEDEQRKRIYSKLQKPESGVSLGQDMHLERFLVIASFSYSQRAEAGHCFWGDSDSNLYGFLQWASRRQSTPCVSAFCELLRAISKTEEYATSAHQFLLDENAGAQAKLRRHGALSWAQILEEFGTFTSRVRDSPNSRSSRRPYESQPDTDDIMEPESVLMLENYLRLMAHLCTESTQARNWVMSLSNPHILEVLFAFCINTVPGRLQACAFMVIRSLITAKSPETSSIVWNSLDVWAFGVNAPSNIARPPKIANPSSWFEEITSKNILASFDQLNEFTLLILALLRPFRLEDIPPDTLPFPENLGSSYRTVGVRPYLDLVMKAFSTEKYLHTDDALKTQVLSNSILRLLIECLASFNETKMVLAGKYSGEDDAALNTKTVSTYVKMHPFSRIMDWLFNDHVLTWLFAISHVDVDEVTVYDPDSVHMQCITYSVEVMNLLFDHQSTYLNAVRPLLKDHFVDQPRPIANISLASFDEKVVQHPQVVLDIGLYAGLGDPKLAHASLALLGKLASSRRLQVESSNFNKSPRPTNTLISILQRDDNLESISRPLANTMVADLQEFQLETVAPGSTIKASILEFLLQTLLSSPGKPSLAHALLGFRCGPTDVDVISDGLFARGLSLFHALAHFAIAYPDGHDDRIELWAIRLRRMATQVLSLLWGSPMTSAHVLPELQESEFFLGLITRQRILISSNIWNSLDTMHPDFLVSESVEILQEVLRLRSQLFEYASVELRFVIKQGTAASRASLLSILHGSVTPHDGQRVSCPSIFDLSEFLDLHFPAALGYPPLERLIRFDCEIFLEAVDRSAEASYQVRLIEASLESRLQELRRLGHLQDPIAEQHAMFESAQIISYAHGKNNHDRLNMAAEDALKSWCCLMALTVETAQSVGGGSKAFIIQAEQTLTPILEVFTFEHDPRAIHIAKLLKYLTISFGHNEDHGSDTAAKEIVNDRGYQVFRAALRSSAAPEVDSGLRETLNQICYGFLLKSFIPAVSTMKGQKILHALKTTGTRHIGGLCDDVLAAEESARVTALLLLDAYCMVAALMENSSIVNALVKSNFLQVMVEAIELIPVELRETNAQGNVA